MPYVRTGIGLLFRDDSEKGKLYLLEVLERYDGNVTRAAQELDITQRQLRRLCVRENLDAAIENMREPEWLRRTKELLQ